MLLEKQIREHQKGNRLAVHIVEAGGFDDAHDDITFSWFDEIEATREAFEAFKRDIEQHTIKGFKSGVEIVSWETYQQWINRS